MNRPAHQAGYGALRRAVGPHHAPRALSRRDWLDLVAAGLAIGRASGGQAGEVADLHAGYALTDFVHLARQARGTAFPAPGVAGAALAEAYLRAAVTLADVFEPQTRAILAAAVGALAAALEELLDLERYRAAETGRRQMGEHEEEG